MRTAAGIAFFILTFSACFGAAVQGSAGGARSIREFGVLPGNPPEKNRENLQRAIDKMSESGGALYVEPAAGGYHVDGGIVLKKNVSLIGAHGPVGRGTKHPSRNEPTGSLFKITDRENPFITVESATQIRGIQFWYPEQSNTRADKIIEYKPTIRMAKNRTVVEGVTLSCLTFFGEFTAMDFHAGEGNACEQILFEHCYGYPLSGEFIKIDRCYDIPRILHCHVNPANMREFGRPFSREVIDSVVARKTFSYRIDRTDNAQMMDIFTFGVYGGIYLGPATYGQLTNFNLDCVTVGIFKDGDNPFNRQWMISQGSIIANAGKTLKDIHPFIIDGIGHTSISNVEAFSGTNSALTGEGKSFDYMLVRGDKPLTVSLSGCRMMNYASGSPFTIENPRAKIRASMCIGKNGEFFDFKKN